MRLLHSSIPIMPSTIAIHSELLWPERTCLSWGDAPIWKYCTKHNHTKDCHVIGSMHARHHAYVGTM